MNQNAEDFVESRRDVVVGQVNGSRCTDKFQEFPDFASGYSATDCIDLLPFPLVKLLRGNHSCNTLPQASFNVFVFSFRNKDDRRIDGGAIAAVRVDSRLLLILFLQQELFDR